MARSVAVVAAVVAGATFAEVAPNPRHAEMMSATPVMQAAILYAEKGGRGLLPLAGADAMPLPTPGDNLALNGPRPAAGPL
jgi:hypothetical protein